MAKIANRDTTRVRLPLRGVVPGAVFRGIGARLATGSLRHNVGTRLLALFLAIGLWVFVNAGQRGSLQSFNVPLSYRNLPPHYLITGPHPESVKIEVTGPRTLLSIIDANRLTVKLDLSGVGVGQASFKVDPDSFNLPRMTTITSITPSQIVLDLDKIVSHAVQVHLVTAGPAPEGYRIEATEVTPRAVTIRGPSRDLERIAEVKSEPIQLAGATGNIARMVALESPSATVRINPSEVAANITLTPIELSKQIHALHVQVRNNGYFAQVDPPYVSLTVHGTELVLDQIDRQSAVYVDADGLAPGNYDVPLQTSLPEGVTLLHQSVSKVRLRMYRGKRTMQG